MPFQFTRYLYVKEEVQLSLLISILKKEQDEALFWAFELYYSFLFEDLKSTLVHIFLYFFASQNWSFGKYMVNQLSQMSSQPLTIAKIICNLIARKHNLDVFLLKLQVSLFEMELSSDQNNLLNCAINIFSLDETNLSNVNNIFLRYDVNPKLVLLAEACKTEWQSPNKYVRVNEEDIVLYETIHMEKQYQILPFAYRYEIDPHNFLCLFHLAREKNGLRGIYLNHWDYFATYTPFWQKHMYDDCEFDFVKKQIWYPEDDGHLYNLEPDEQSKETQNKVLKDLVQGKTWHDFIEMFGQNNTYLLEDEYVEELGKISLFQQESFLY